MADDRWSHYLPASPVLRDSGLACRGAGEQRMRPTMAPRRLSTHGLLFVTEGRGRYSGAPYVEPVEVVAPAVIWLFPGVQHTYDPDHGDWQEHWVLFEGTAARAYESLQAWRRSEPVLPAAADLHAEVAPLFATLRAGTATPGRQAELLAATRTCALIGIAAASTGRFAQDQRSGRPESVVDLVVGAALGPGSVTERARAVGLSAGQLRREVAEQTSLSVHDLIIRTRIARAQTLLATTDMSVGSIARQVGYDDPAYFSRLFSARVGVAPRTFREQAVR